MMDASRGLSGRLPCRAAAPRPPWLSRKRYGGSCRATEGRRCRRRLGGDRIEGPAHIELENSGNHHDRLGPVTVLEQRELEGFGTADEQAAMQVLAILHHPAAAAVLADEE